VSTRKFELQIRRQIRSARCSDLSSNLKFELVSTL